MHSTECKSAKPIELNDRASPPNAPAAQEKIPPGQLRPIATVDFDLANDTDSAGCENFVKAQRLILNGFPVKPLGQKDMPGI